MNMRAALLIGTILGAVAASSHAAVSFQWVTVGNPAALFDFTCKGSVPYTYQSGKYEVTNGQYVPFLNAKAASDPLEFYNANMALDAGGGIVRSGSPGGYSYAVKAGYANKPVVYVGLYDAMRFANWVQNGQGAGGTETGAYTLLGGTPIPANAGNVNRNAGATTFLPT